MRYAMGAVIVLVGLAFTLLLGTSQQNDSPRQQSGGWKTDFDKHMAAPHFWFAWAAFKPETGVYGS